MKYCIYCGAEMPEDANYCGYCGKSVFKSLTELEQKIDTSKQQDLQALFVEHKWPSNNQYYKTKYNTTPEYEQEKRNVSGKGGIGITAIVLCAIAAVMLITVIILLVVRNTKPKYRIVNRVQAVQTAQMSSNKTKLATEEAVELTKKWDAIHNSKKAEEFANIYASQVNYYHQTYTPEKIVASKRDLFAKAPNFRQSVSDFKVTNNDDGSIKVHFDKIVQTSINEATKTYPSYLIIKKINNNWQIVEESDDITDANLAKKKDKQINSQLSRMEKIGEHYGIELYYKIEWNEGTSDDGSPDWFPQPAQYSLYAYYPDELKLEKLITEPSYSSEVKCTKHQSLHPEDTGVITIEAIGYGFHSISKDRILVCGCPDSRNIYSYLFDIPTKKAVLLRSFDGFKEVRNEKGENVIVMLARRYYPEGGFYYFENLYNMNGYYVGEGLRLGN